MSKYIDADLLIRKIKGQIRLENLNFAALGGGGQTFCINTLEWVLKIIDSLQQEQPEVDLEKEFQEYWYLHQYDHRLRRQVMDGHGKAVLRNVAGHFYELGQSIQYQKDRREFSKLKAKEWKEGYDIGYAKGLNARKENKK